MYRPDRNFITGRFLPNRTPFNKGMKWDDYLPKEVQENIIKGLEYGRLRKGQPAPCAGWNARKVVCFDKYGNPRTFASASEAGRRIGAPDRNIRLCCDGKRKRVHGITFYWFDDDRWIEIYKQQTI